MSANRLIRFAVIGAWCLSGILLSAQAPQTQSSLQTPPGQPRQYTGTPYDFDFQGADLRMVLRSFAELSGLNLVIDPAVDGTVDIKLTKVPWDQALEVILKSSKLGYIVEGTVIRVVPLDVLAAEEAAKQKLADSQAPAALAVRTFTLNYAQAADLEPLIKVAALSKFGFIQHDKRTNVLIVRDIPDRLDSLAELIATLDRPEAQVEIEARIVQTNRDSARELGLQWGGGGEVSPALGNTTGLNFPNTGSLQGGFNRPTLAGVDRDGIITTSPGETAARLALGSINGALKLDVALSALERSGNGRIISAPKVTTQNNKQAEMTQGVQIPVQKEVNNTVTVEFKDAALKLLVTPRITAANTVIMDVELENGSPGEIVAGNNRAINTQRARSSVQVSDGATTVIGGINVSTETTAQSRTPVLHRIPLLGWLFKSDVSEDRNTELVIFITPRIVRGRP
jgi:type IV pilus assembly protein PilQ